jgi:NDP-sugar pyrophosphorylase family protein
MEYLRKHGVEEIVVNAHHHAGQMVDFLTRHALPGVKLEVRLEAEILGTGGGIRNTADFWGRDPFIVLNSDILTDLDITGAFEQHLEKRPPATLVLHDQPPYNKIEVCDDRITDIPKEYGAGGLAFTGIHIMEPETLSHIPEGYSDIVDCYRKLITAGGTSEIFPSISGQIKSLHPDHSLWVRAAKWIPRRNGPIGP